MLPKRCAARREVAQRAIRTHINTLAERFGLADAQVPLAIRVRQPDVAAMETEEALVTLLAELVAKTAPPEPAAKKRGA